MKVLHLTLVVFILSLGFSPLLADRPFFLKKLTPWGAAKKETPEAPAAVKAVAKSSESIVVSWQPPSKYNGTLTNYTVYLKEQNDRRDPKGQRVEPSEASYEASGLKENGKYTVWVTASTDNGEGQKSIILSVNLSSEVPAKIGSFNGNLNAKYLQDITLPCLVVGVPVPDVTWKLNGVILEPSDRIQKLANGSLLIKSASKTDTGEYTCSVENKLGKDSVTHQLVVLATPYKPKVTFTSSTKKSMSLELEPNPKDTEPILGYTVRFQPQFQPWQTTELGPSIRNFTLENLLCGTQYAIGISAYTSDGTGDESEILTAKTIGSQAVKPDASIFLSNLTTDSITIHLSTWTDGGCPLTNFVVENYRRYKYKENVVYKSKNPAGDVVISGLSYGTWYVVRVRADNEAGGSIGAYEYKTKSPPPPED